jgi:glucosamine--fructose-6-phosphate aminotransferase (isomerizing)
MCGIVGYVGREERAQDVILDGLRRLEYRGYDSAGIAVIEDGKLRVVRAVGKLVNLEATLRDVPVHGSIGIGHTRWATQGRPAVVNAHPHCAGTVALVHNGIIENHAELRTQLEARGCRFQGETDSELIAHLIHQERKQGNSLLEAVQVAVTRLDGSYAIAIIDEEHPGSLITARNAGSPVIVGLGEEENFVASDVPAIRPYTRQMIMLEDGEVAHLTQDSIEIFDSHGARLERSPKLIQWVLEEEGDINLDGIELDPEWVRQLEGVQFVACGTAWHACLIGKHMLERAARIPTLVDLASEFRYQDPLIGSRHLIIPVSQSGETADTLASRSATCSIAASRGRPTPRSIPTRARRSPSPRPSVSRLRGRRCT